MAKRPPIAPGSSPFKAFVNAAITKAANEEGPIDVVATVTTDCVDADREVVLPGGVDLERYLESPRIQLCHATGSRPGEFYILPIGKALWTRRTANSLVQGIQFADTPMAREVAELFRTGFINTFSIGFRSLEASPPTKEEKRIRPDWAKAALIHRQWELLEVSVVPIPCNPEATGEWVRKGKSIPAFVWTTPAMREIINKGSVVEPESAEETIVDPADESVADESRVVTKTAPAPDEDLEGDAATTAANFKEMKTALVARHKSIMHSGKAGHLYASPDSFKAMMVRHKDDDMEEMGYHSAAQCKAMLGSAPHCKGVDIADDHPSEGDSYERLHPPPEGYQNAADAAKALDESSGTNGGYATREIVDGGEIPPVTSPTPEAGARGDGYVPQTGHVVRWKSYDGMHAGCGKCLAIHKSGKIPGVMNHEAMADEDNHHAKVKLFRKMTDDDASYEETDHHVAVKCKACERMPMLAMLPQAKAAETAPKAAKTTKPEVADADEPQLSKIPSYRTKSQVEAERDRKIREAHESITLSPEDVKTIVLERMLGAV